nr:uncharacterized protein LOC125422126 [Ziziphus jujuba var. spinosa]
MDKAMREDVAMGKDLDGAGSLVMITTVTFKEEEDQQEAMGEEFQLQEKANYVEERSQEDGILLLAYKDNERSEDHTWYLDTRASNHMYERRGMFVELDESMRGSVSFGDESKLLEKGYDIHLKENHLCTRDNVSNLITKVLMLRNRIFMFNIQNDAAKFLKACYKDESWLWNLRFRHLNFGGSELLYKREMVRGLPSIRNPDQEKSKVFENFENFKALVEKESSILIKSMISDCGGEFTSNEFQKFCEDHEIRRFLTQEIAKGVLVEAVAYVVYLSNQSLTRSVWGKTSQEAWSGRKPSISHLRVFGNIAHVHVPGEKRSKLDEKSEKYVFIGYDINFKGYKLYNPKFGKIVISQDVIFSEEEEWNWESHDESYNFFSYLEEEKAEQPGMVLMREEPITSPASPTAGLQEGRSSSDTSI